MSTIELPWGKWHPETHRRVDFPSDWEVDVLQPSLPPPMSKKEIGVQVRKAVTAVPTGFRRACVVVEDPARPAQLTQLLEELLPAIQERSPAGKVVLLVATGCHVWADDRAFQAKYGSPALSTVRLHIHAASDEMIDTGLKFGPVPVRLNRLFVESDCRILIGSVVPHPFAGFSGGAKTVLPGIADRACTEYSHKMVRLGGNLSDDPDKNRFRQLIERIVRELKIDLTFCLVPTPSGKISGVFWGDVLQAYRSAIAKARDGFYVPVSRRYDVLLLNAYPKDMDLVQSRAALACLPRDLDSVLAPNGTIILATSSPHGARGHGLFSPEGSLYAPPRPDPRTRDRDVLVWTDAPTEEVNRIFPVEYPVLRSWEQVLEHVRPRVTRSLSIGVVPCAAVTRLV